MSSYPRWAVRYRRLKQRLPEGVSIRIAFNSDAIVVVETNFYDRLSPDSWPEAERIIAEAGQKLLALAEGETE